jgi:hypothetical protein
MLLENMGLTGKFPIFDRTLCARPDANHIAHFRKMVGHGMAAFGAGFFGLFNHRLEVAEVEVFEHTGKIARGPEIRTGGIDALDAFEGVAGGGDWQLIAHRLPFTPSHGSDEERIAHTFCGRKRSESSLVIIPPGKHRASTLNI